MYRKFSKNIEDFLTNEPEKILLVNGARQVGKSYLIRQVGKRLFPNFVEINFQEDKEGSAVFANVRTTHDFYVKLGSYAGDKLGNAKNTLVFLDEIQAYPQLLTMLKFLRQEARYRYIASGSQLGIALMQTPSVPIGSIERQEMYPMDFEEYLIANGWNDEAIGYLREHYERKESLDETMHNQVMNLFRQYLLTGGLPEAVSNFLKNENVFKLRRVQQNIYDMYGMDASKYDEEQKLMIKRVYELILSYMENKKKRIMVKHIEGKSGKEFADYAEEFEYLIHSGVSLSVHAISNPHFPLLESESKNLLKLYLNDVGLLTFMLYRTNIEAVLNDERSINLGSVYETVVAQELHAHGHQLFYYDNKQKGEVDFLIDDFDQLSVLPIEVKSGKDYTRHKALDKFLSCSDYHIKNACVLSNEREVYNKGNVWYMPVYFVMFMRSASLQEY